MQHPELSQTSLPASIGTHLSIMPTIIEAIAPKGFEYYAAVPSAFDEQPDVHVTPYQWITSDMVGDVLGDYGQYQTYTRNHPNTSAQSITMHRTRNTGAPYRRG